MDLLCALKAPQQHLYNSHEMDTREADQRLLGGKLQKQKCWDILKKLTADDEKWREAVADLQRHLEVYWAVITQPATNQGHGWMNGMCGVECYDHINYRL